MKKTNIPIRIMKESFTYEFKDFSLLLCSFLAQSIVFSCSPYFVEKFINSIQDSTSNFIFSFVCVSIVLFLKPIVNFFNVLIINIFSKKMRMHYSSAVHRKIALNSAEKFEDIKCTEKIKLAIDGAISASLATIAIPSILTFFTPYFIFLSIYFFQTKPIFGYIALIIFIPIILSQCIRTYLIYKFKKNIVGDEIKETYFENLIINPTSLKEIRILLENQKFLEIYNISLKKVSYLKGKNERKLMLVSFFCDLMSTIGLSTTIFILIYSVIDKSITIAAFIAILTAILEMFNWMNDLANYDAKDLFNKLGSIINYYELIDEKLDNANKIIGNEIIIKNVSFKYMHSDNYALKNINLTIKPNSKIGIVGKNGSGKSTLVNLILGLYQPTEGSIQRLEEGSTPCKASAVFQNYSKYKLSLRTNLVIGEEKTRSDEVLKSQLEKSQFNQEECTLDTVLSNEFDGIDLSKGQWQKVAILRGQRDFFDLLVLDEPTASIDPLQESAIINYFEMMSKESTLILVTHRLNAIRLIDQILVIDEGEIVEKGSHEELMDFKGIYYQMYTEQKNKFIDL